MKLTEYKADEQQLNGAIITTLTAKVDFDSDDVEERLFEDAYAHGDEKYVRISVNSALSNDQEPYSTISIIRDGNKTDTYRLIFLKENESDEVPRKVDVDADIKLKDSALISFLPFMNEWYWRLYNEAIEVFKSLSLSESVSASESLSVEISNLESQLVSESESLSASLSSSLSESESVFHSFVSESVNVLLSESMAQIQSVYQSEQDSASATFDSESASISLQNEDAIESATLEYEALCSEIDSRFNTAMTVAYDVYASEKASLREVFEADIYSLSLREAQMVEEAINGVSIEQQEVVYLPTSQEIVSEEVISKEVISEEVISEEGSSFDSEVSESTESESESVFKGIDSDSETSESHNLDSLSELLSDSTPSSVGSNASKLSENTSQNSYDSNSLADTDSQEDALSRYETGWIEATTQLDTDLMPDIDLDEITIKDEKPKKGIFGGLFRSKSRRVKKSKKGKSKNEEVSEVAFFNDTEESEVKTSVTFVDEKSSSEKASYGNSTTRKKFEVGDGAFRIEFDD